jgi:hypothetical protein
MFLYFHDFLWFLFNFVCVCVCVCVCVLEILVCLNSARIGILLSKEIAVMDAALEWVWSLRWQVSLGSKWQRESDWGAAQGILNDSGALRMPGKQASDFPISGTHGTRKLGEKS